MPVEGLLTGRSSTCSNWSGPVLHTAGGLFMGLAFGVAPFAVVLGLYDGRRWAPYGTIVVGIVLVGWAVVEGFVLGFGERLQYLNLLHGIVLVAVAAVSSLRGRTASLGVGWADFGVAALHRKR